jgi:hypothetical protein
MKWRTKNSRNFEERLVKEERISTKHNVPLGRELMHMRNLGQLRKNLVEGKAGRERDEQEAKLKNIVDSTHFNSKTSNSHNAEQPLLRHRLAPDPSVTCQLCNHCPPLYRPGTQTLGLITRLSLFLLVVHAPESA